MKRVLLSVFVVLLALLTAGCPAAKTKKVVIATDATWPPMEYVNEAKAIVGFDIDLFKLVAEKGGFEVEFRNTAWDGIFAGLAAGEYDAVVSSVTITDERKQTMDFSDKYLNAGQVLIVRTGTTGVAKLSDLAGKTAGAQIGTTGAIEIGNVKDITLKTYDELGMAIEDLNQGRLDAVVADTPIAADFALQNENYKGKLMIVGKPFTEEYYGAAIQKGNKKIADLINAGLKKVLNTPEYEALLDKWLR
jgi:polar amino acid transport system substrate-binding protein